MSDQTVSDEESRALTLVVAYDLMSEEERKKLFLFMLGVVKFYGDPWTWWATMLIPDRPAGPINHDYRKDYEGQYRPGGRARLAFYHVMSALGKKVGIKGPFQIPPPY
jgi:hypothetical protein